MQFTKRAVVVEAIQFEGGPQSAQEVIEWVTERGGEATFTPSVDTSAVTGRAPSEEYVAIAGEAGPVAAFTDWWAVHDSEADVFRTYPPKAFAATFEV